MVISLAALTGGQFELQRDRIAHDRCRCLDRLLGEHCPAEIGVQHRSG